MNINNETTLITDTYVPPQLLEVYVCQKENHNSYLVINSRGPNWFVTNKLGVFLVEICNGEISLGDIKQLLKQAGLDIRSGLLENFFAFLDKICFFDEGKDGHIDLLASVFLNITAQCNLKCIYCYYDSNSSRPVRQEAPLDVWANIIRQIYVINPAAIITISGGEPFLSGNLFPILNVLHELHMKTRIYTNGTKIKDEEITQLMMYDNIEYIQISLDSVVNEENFKTRTVYPAKVMETLCRLKENGLPLLISCTVTEVNVDSIQLLVDYCSEHDFKYRFVKYFPTAGRASENISSYRVEELKLADKIGHLEGNDNHNVNISKGYSRLKKRTVCGLGKMLSVSESAKLYPCNHLYIDKFIMGDAAIEPVLDIIERSHDIFRAVPVDTMNPCKKCALRYLCGGSCRATAYHEKGRLDVNTSDCNFLKEVIVNTLWEQCLGDRKNFNTDEWRILD